MRALLERAGFRLRSARRADCAHCYGRSRGTVAFNVEVAFCHRCHWRANTVTLARELGLFPNDPRTREAMRRARERRERLQLPIRAFEQWRDAELRRVTDEYRVLTRQAALAESVLGVYPDCESAWDALANFCHQEAALVAEIDRLSCSKLSEYLESPCSITQLFLEWRATAHAA
jgi:hypothetical protein